MSDNTQYKFLSHAADNTDSSDTKRPGLVMIKGDFIGEVYELANDVTMVGRSDEVDLTVSDLSISRRHALIVNRAEGLSCL